MMRLENGHNGGQRVTLHSFFFFALIGFSFLLISRSAFGLLTTQDVLILVNANSPTSRYIAKLYRQYYPAITDSQILYLPGLADCSGPAATQDTEIITRQNYDNLIAAPLRAYLADSNYPNRISTIKVIITTAGLPYRIKDTYYSDVVYGAGSNYNTVGQNLTNIDAASVESELTCLWYSNYLPNSFGLKNRIVNPYQGYRQSSVSFFPRAIPGAKTMLWNYVLTNNGPLMEGQGAGLETSISAGTTNRHFNAGDMYLTCRLDGPKKRGQSAVFAVRAMLERAKKASSAAYGVNPAQAVAVFDDAPSKSTNLDRNRVYNLDRFAPYYWIFAAGIDQPPDAPGVLQRDDYSTGFSAVTGQNVSPILNIAAMASARELCVMLDRRNYTRTSQYDLDTYAAGNPSRTAAQGIILLATFGVNGDEGGSAKYLLEGGLGQTALFNAVNGAVFTSLESFNAATMFSDVNTLPAAQGKLVDFLQMGGTGAIGHSFEPQTDAAVDNEFLFYNFLADADGDGYADLTFAEAAFTGIPFLSWDEIVIGDPLMRIAYGPGGFAWRPFSGDIDNNGRVNAYDVYLVRRADGGVLNSTDSTVFDKYNDLCDINQDGRVNSYDVYLVRLREGAISP